MYIDMASNNKTHNTKIGSKVMKKCSICKQPIQPDRLPYPSGWSGGHNAEPINSGRCCGMCNDLVVTPRRMADYLERNNNESK
jgi:hypothetical protein